MATAKNNDRLGRAAGPVGPRTLCIGKLAIGNVFRLRQPAAGHIAIGQFAYGEYVLAQLGWGEHVVDSRTVDIAAKEFFLGLIGK